MTLVPLYDLTQQFNNKNGAVLVGGKLYVYYVGRTELATTWADEDAAATNPNPVLLDNNGRAPVFVDDSYSYTLVVCDRNGAELFSQDITPGGDGSVGGRIVYHDDTLSGTGTVSSLLGVIKIPLGVDETMTAYTGVAEGKDALILGVNGDWFNETFSSQFNEKVDWDTFSACCSGVKGGLATKLDASAINNYYTKNEFDERTSSFVNYNFLSGNYYNKNETSSREELASAFASAGQGGGGDRTPWISGSKTISSMGYLEPGQWFQMLSSFELSGVKNHYISMKGASYNFPTTAMFYDWLDLGQYMKQTDFDNFYSAGYQPAINDLYNSANFNTTNKLDISSFNDWSAAYAPTTPSYEVSAGNWIDVVADDVEHIKVVSVTGLEEVISGVSATLDNKIDDVSSTLTNEFSSFSSTITNEFSSFSSTITGDLTDKKDKQSYTTFTAEDGQFITGLEQDTNGEIVSASFGGYSDISPAISSTEVIGSTKPMIGDMLIQVLSSISLSGDKNHGIIMEGSVYRFPNNNELASGINQTNTFLTQSAFSSYSNAITDNLSILYGQDNYLSGRIDNLVTNKLDVSAFESYTANDETYTLIGGNKIGISSNDATQETTIYFTGTNGDEEVNNVVRNFSANGTWLTGVDLTPYQEKSEMTAYQPVSSMTGYYPMTGNPSGFLTAVDLTPYLTTADANTISSTLSGAITALSSEVPQLSAGEGIDISTVDGKTVITNSISAGENISLVYDSESNKVRIDCEITGDLGHTYTGVAPIIVDNVNDQISISGESLSAGPGINIFGSGGYVVISANVSNCYCLLLNPSNTSVNLENYSAYDKLTILHAKEYGSTYQIHWDGKTKEIPSGLYIEMGKVKDMNNLDKWTFLNSGWANNGWWDYD